MEERITAIWAREKASTIKGEKVQMQLSQIDDLIEEAVGKNLFSINFFETLEKLAEGDLLLRGFSVKLNRADPGDQRERDYITISW